MVYRNAWLSIAFAIPLLFPGMLHAGKFEKIFTGGLSLGLADMSSELRPGFNLGLSGISLPVKYFGVGGHVGYNRWSIPEPGKLIVADKGSLHFIETSVVIRGLAPIDRNIRFFGEVCPGLQVGVVRRYSDPPTGDADANFGMSFCFGLDVRCFEVAPKFKTIIAGPRKGTKWLALSAGFVF